MKVMVLVKATADSEAGRLPREDEWRAMGAYNDRLAEAGILLAAEGLQPSSHGRRVRFGRQQRQAIDGPFDGAHDLVAGFWLWQVRSLDEATEWLKRAPFEPGMEVELRPLMDFQELGDALPPDLLQARERRLRQCNPG